MDGYGWEITPVAQSTKCRSEVTIACIAQLLFLLLKILYDSVVVVCFFQISFWKNVFSALFLLVIKQDLDEYNAITLYSSIELIVLVGAYL